MSTESEKISRAETVPEVRTGGKVARLILMGFCVALMIYALSIHWWLVPSYKELGPEGYFNQYGLAGIVGLFGLMASVPVAVILGVVGVAVVARVEWKRIAAFVVAGLIVLIVPEPELGAYPVESVPSIFGLGGALIELFLLLTIWFWAKERVQLGGRAGLAADLRMVGYVFLAFGTWFMCSMGAVGAFGLYPEKMLEFGTQEIAVDLMYRILTCMVLGWGLTFAGQRVAARVGRTAGD